MSRATLRAWCRWAERLLLLPVTCGIALALGLRDGIVPLSSVLFYATPLPLVCAGALSGVILAGLQGQRRRVKFWSFLVLFVLALVLSRDCFRPAPPPPLRDGLRVLTWNVNGASAGPQRLLAALGELDPDLVCFGEVGHARDPKRGFVHELAGHLRARGYLTRSWPQARIVIGLRAEGGTLGRQRLQRTGGSVAKILHVDATWHGRALRIAAVDFRSTPTINRGPAAAKLLSELGSGPWICAGDFNTPLASRCFDPWRAAGALHAFEAAGQGYAPTWPNPLPLMTIDHVWTHGLVPRSASAPLRPESDHCPVLTELGWSP